MTTVVAIAGAGDLVENGLREIVAQAADIEVRDVWGVAPDVVLYDAMGLLADGGAELALLLESHRSAIVVVGRDLRPGLAARAIARGAFSCVSMEAPAHEILDAIRSAAVADSTTPATPPVGLGHEVHLTAREVMVVAGIARGMRNRDIAELCALSPNTVKSYVRSAYRKMGVTCRAQAVGWCLGHGFDASDEGSPRQTVGR
jgi:DNA-binding NarL/FixJ family response regulator